MQKNHHPAIVKTMMPDSMLSIIFFFDFFFFSAMRFDYSTSYFDLCLRSMSFVMATIIIAIIWIAEFTKFYLIVLGVSGCILVLGVGERKSLLDLLDSGRRLENRNASISISLGSYLVRTCGSSPTPQNKKKSEQMFGVFLGAGSRSRTYEGRSRQIYSLMRLTTSLSQRCNNISISVRILQSKKNPP